MSERSEPAVLILAGADLHGSPGDDRGIWTCNVHALGLAYCFEGASQNYMSNDMCWWDSEDDLRETV